MSKRLFITFLCFSSIFSASAQRTLFKTANKLAWTAPQELKLTEERSVKILYFENAIYDEQTHYVPHYFKKVELDVEPKNLNVVLTNPVYETLTKEEVNLINNKSMIMDQVFIRKEVGYHRKQPVALISFIPIRKNASGQYEKLVDFELQLQASAIEGSPVRTRTYANNSVLASGNWYKIGVTQTGIHQITHSYLSSIGLSPGSINPKNIRIYGNGGGMLPIYNGTDRKDDLVENAIHVRGEADGTFSSDDFILFYGEGPSTWTYSTTDNRFHHAKNLYSDTTYYFLNFDIGAGKRIAPQSSSSQTATHTVSSFDDYAFHENDQKNLIKSGKQWYGEHFDIIEDYTFNFSFPNIDPAGEVYIKTDLVGRAGNSCSYYILSGGDTTEFYTTSVDMDCYYCDFADAGIGTLTYTTSTPSVSVKVTKNTSNAEAWLNYVELNARRKLTMSGSQMSFRDMQSVGTGNIAQFSLTSSAAVTIWEVTDIEEVKTQALNTVGNEYQFTLATDSLREFIAFSGGYLTPTYFGKVANQNLHGLGTTDYVIVTHPKFINEATELANLHKTNDGLNVAVVTPQQIYNEFSSGAQDISAIRDFMKMLYDRAPTTNEIPRYLLLFGDGSYDNRNVTRYSSSNSNYIPTFQSSNSITPTSSYVSDDFYGLLDDNEGGWVTNVDLVDVGIGRFPVRTTDEAQAVLAKIKKYVATGGVNEVTNYGDWRNIICFVGDDEDQNIHTSQANSLATNIDTTYGIYNIDKIFLDAYKQESTPGGNRYPEATDAFVNRVEKGALIVNFTGHGGEVGLTHERLLELAHINNWSNFDRLPLFVTATCEFSRYDDPERTSAGELVLINEEGGGIGLLTTVRLVYASPNFVLNKNFYNVAFEELNGEMPRFGDLYRLTKVASGTSVNNRNFTLLGDPALRLAYPKYEVTTTSINGVAVDSASIDTLKALSKITVSGYVNDENGNKLNYNGLLFPTVYDKAVKVTTLSNDGNASPPMTFTLQKNILYKGKVSVSNGNFSFSFIVPKDIQYNYGIGRISYYAYNGQSDAAGYYENLYIGGSESSVGNDELGPEIDLYMNDENFVFGGLTDENPEIYAIIFDSSGVNTVGNGIGHDVTAILDGNTEKAIVLNEYYEADLDSYQSGKIKYPLSDLDEGKHDLTVKVWDVYNNSSEAQTEFVVAKSAKLALDHVLNYPNPFTTKTSFFFEHNQVETAMDVLIQIYTASGRIVKTIQTTVNTDGFRSEGIEWDGKDDFGDNIGKGVYVYRLSARNADGEVADKFEKLVILK